MAPRRNITISRRLRATIARGRPPCHLCGEPINYDLPHTDPMSFELDHIVPLARGGADHISNAAASHRACNRTKGDRTDGGPILRRSGSLARPQ
ncbi:HNH endonuclease [Micromonospora sp. NPDC049836]|uniref:HNH endonuclease n=1 Tax=Micromonospora sp. NPDC049836 TaxID=3364274 RepID=UPI0037BCFD0B